MDWFIELKKYQDSKIKNQTENFISSVLVGILEADHETREGLLQKLFEIDDPSIIELDTQKSFKNSTKIPDIWVIQKNENDDVTYAGIIECKVDSSPYQEQLEEYKELIQEEYPNVDTKVILLCKKGTDKHLNRDKSNTFYWYQLYEMLSSESDIQAIQYLRNEFKKLMEKENMVPHKPLDEDWLHVNVKYHSYVETIKHLVDKVSKKLEDNNGIKIRKYAHDKPNWFRFTELESSSGAQFLLWFYWEWWDKPEERALVVDIRIDQPHEFIESLRNTRFTLSNGQILKYNDSVMGYYRGCHFAIRIDRKYHDKFWNFNDFDEQVEHLYSISLEILKCISIISE